MVFRNQLSPAVLAKHRMQVTGVVGTLSIILSHPPDSDIEWVDLVVIAPILQRDCHVIVGLAYVGLMHIVDGQFLVVPGLPVRL